MCQGGSVTQQTPDLSWVQERFPGQVVTPADAFQHVHRGDRIFLGTGCGYPQYLVEELVAFTREHPKAFFDTEVLHVWTLGVNPYLREEVRRNFRLNSFFVSGSTRDAVNEGSADYTAIFLSRVPELFARGVIPVDVALIQTSPPDEHGFVSLGISVDTVRMAVDQARTVICQINPFMPRTHGDSFVHMSKVDFAVPHAEPLLTLPSQHVEDDVAESIGKYVARLVQDGDTIQVGYGRIPDAILSSLAHRKHLGVHTELLSDGLVALMQAGVVDNTRKAIDRHKTVAAFCMGSTSTYEYLHDNPAVAFRSVDYTNNPSVISRIPRMVAINSALQIDLSGQATAESLDGQVYSGVGGQPDFMRGAVLSPEGRSVLVLPSTARQGKVSRIVPCLSEGAGVTLTRSDV
ncbi:MAG TPA: acetyl-CoA hydrolase/transferase family protein, partial [Candidatus Acetothermia bacterium]|nr:acetyl-CoA hydrolase/transferase family protein [Candidatus Acetothermia bacterium]